MKRNFYSTNSNNNKNLAAGERLEIVSRLSRFLLKKKLFSNFSFVFFFVCFWNLEKLSSQAAERDGLRRRPFLHFFRLWNVFHTFNYWPDCWQLRTAPLFFGRPRSKGGWGKKQNSKKVGMESAWAQRWGMAAFVWLFWFLSFLFSECPLPPRLLLPHCRPRRTCRPASGTACPSHSGDRNPARRPLS